MSTLCFIAFALSVYAVIYSVGNLVVGVLEKKRAERRIARERVEELSETERLLVAGVELIRAHDRYSAPWEQHNVYIRDNGERVFRVSVELVHDTTTT